MTQGDDYKAVVRRGLKIPGPHMVMYLRRGPAAQPVRFGFIVAKTVGGAVSRNLVRRRMKAATYSLLPTLEPGIDVVIRALPGADQVPWPVLHAEIADAINSGSARR